MDLDGNIFTPEATALLAVSHIPLDEAVTFAHSSGRRESPLRALNKGLSYGIVILSLFPNRPCCQLQLRASNTDKDLVF